MIYREAKFVKAYSIDEAWREVMSLCLHNGYDFVVKGGSYVGQIRRQLEHVTIYITNPAQRPLSPTLSEGIPRPTTEQNIEDYFANYIINEKIPGNEQYTYGSYIVPQLEAAMQKLEAADGGSNQACITIGSKESILLPDPPCLRNITFKVVNGKLNMTVFFRSWDLFAGLPENLGGMQLLKEYALTFLNGVEDGALIAYSDGLHLYEQYFNLIPMLIVEGEVKVDDDILQDKKDFSKIPPYSDPNNY